MLGTVTAGSRSSRARARGLLLVTLLALTAMAPAASADSAVVMGARMLGTSDAGAAWTGSHALLFGGVLGGEFVDAIQAYDPDRDTVRVLDATLPSPRAHAAVAFDGAAAFVIGGEGADGALDEIVRFDAATGDVVVLDATLPAPAADARAVWTGSEVLVFVGGDVLALDPSTGTLATLNVTLPLEAVNGVAWNGSHALLVNQSHVAAFDPVTGESVVLDATLPVARERASVLLAEGALVVLGGHALDENATALDDVLVLDAGAFVASDATLPTARYGVAGVWTGAHAFLFGHANPESFNAARQIVRVDFRDRLTDGTGVQVNVEGDGDHEYWYGANPTGDRYLWGGERGNLRWDVGSHDGDFVPDDAEPVLCDVEDDGSSLDGQCPHGNYERPSKYGVERALDE